MQQELTQLVVAYRQYLVVQRGVHPATASRYVRYVSSWLSFLGTRGKTLVEASPEDALAWWELERERYHPTTSQMVLSAVRNFYGWLRTNRGMLLPDLWTGYRVRRVFEFVRPYLTEGQVRAILSLPVRPTPADIRDRALFALLYSSGARISEILALNVTDLQPAEHRVFLRATKTKAVRSALLVGEAWELLERYMRTARPLLLALRKRPGPEPALWLGQRGTRWNRESARVAMIRLCERAGVPVPVTPHGIRKSIATHLWRRSRDLVMIQQFLGHRSLRSTERYLAAVHEEELERAATYHPLRALLGGA